MEDPVASGWVSEPHATLLGLGAAVKVSVYYRKCSNPYVSLSCMDVLGAAYSLASVILCGVDKGLLLW